MSYPLFTGAVMVAFLGVRTIVNISEKDIPPKMLFKCILVMSLSVLLTVTINYFAQNSYKGLLIFAALPLLSVASSVIAVKLIKEEKQIRHFLYITLLPAGIAVLAAQYATSYAAVLIYSLRSILEFLVIALLTFKIYKTVKDDIPDIFKGIPAILILISLISMVLGGLK
ncbi:MAG: hypothetical protein PF545_01965 [Elusimicrobia bacterium]|jgi:Na+-translocating ferredoxin:NAD+ oxidoreductase RnfA subunit|nr:hypothetical protein [Elusimicrobiota bacterium]